jgi:hypothetical protein
MTQNEIIEIAGQHFCRIEYGNGNVHEGYEFSFEELEAFAKLVAAKATEEANARANASWTLMCKKMVAFEREACANLCWKNEDDNAFVNHGGKRLDLLCAELIKARGEE